MINTRALALAALTLTLANCTKPQADRGSSAQDQSVIESPLEISNSAELNADQKDIFDRIKAHKPVSFNRITKLMIEKHVEYSTGKHPEVTRQVLQMFLDKITPPNMTPAKTKIAYEEKIKALHGGKPLVYNIEKTSIVDIYSEGRMQCASGTYLYELVRRQSGAAQFRANNEVVIFEAGHVLPGYMVKTNEGFKLFGIETTEAGGARTSLGLAKDLGTNTVIVDSELFAVSEVFANKISNPREVALAMRKATAQKYGIPFQETSVTSGDSATDDSKRQLNQSIFAFGQPSDLTPGDRERMDSFDDGQKTEAEQFSGAVTQMALPELPQDYQELVAENCQTLNGTYVNLPDARSPLPENNRLQGISVKSCDAITMIFDKDYRATGKLAAPRTSGFFKMGILYPSGGGSSLEILVASGNTFIIGFGGDQFQRISTKVPVSQQSIPSLGKKDSPVDDGR